MPDYTITQSVVGSPGALNATNYAIPGGYPMAANPIGTGTGILPAGQQNMNAGVFEQGLIRLVRGQLMYCNPNWIKQTSIPRGNRPRAVMFKVNEININEANPSVYKLVEGVTPDTNLSLTVDTIEIVPQQYGVVMYFSDIVEETTYFQFKTTVIERLGWALGRVLDAIVKLFYFATVPDDTAIFTGFEGQGNLSWLRLLRLRARLDAQDIQPPESEGEFFPMIVHPDQMSDLLSDADIRAAITHSNVGWDPSRNPMVHPARLGEAAGFRFYKTSRCQRYDTADGDTNSNGYINLVVGRELMAATTFASPQVGAVPSLGAVYRQGGGLQEGAVSSPVQIIEKGLGSAGSFDPLNQQQSIGAKWTWGMTMMHPTHGSQIQSTSGYHVPTPM